MMTIRFDLDETVPSVVADLLALRGVDAVAGRGSTPLRQEDKRRLAAAGTDDRVLVTTSDAFLRLHLQGFPHAGIVHVSNSYPTISRQIHCLLRLWRTRTAEEVRGRVVFV